MSDSSDFPAPPATLAEVIARVKVTPLLCDKRRREVERALLKVSVLQGLPPEQISANPDDCRTWLAGLVPASIGLAPGTIRNMKSLAASGFSVAGATRTRRRSMAPMESSWAALLARLRDKYDRTKLSRFARYCAARGIEPVDVDATVFAAFAKDLAEASMVARHKQVVRDTALAWNRGVDSIDGWPATLLAAPSASRVYALPLCSFPDSFQQDFRAFFRRLADNDPFSENPHGAASEATLRDRRIQYLELASALVHTGRDIASIKSLADLVEVEAAKQILRFFWGRNGQRKTGQLHNLARRLVDVAKHWVGVTGEQLDQLKRLRKDLDPGKGGLSEKVIARLRQFVDDINVERLINLPERMIAQIEAKAEPTRNDAVYVQIAVALALNLVAPMRAKNLAALSLSQNICRSHPGPNGVVHLVIPSSDVKNKVPLEFELAPDVVRLLDLYLTKYRPMLFKGPSDALFPNRTGSSKDPGPFGVQIKDEIRDGTGLTVHLHLVRHLCAFLFLKANPGEYETVRQLLGHKDIATTMRFYVWLERSDAFKRYDAMLDRYRKKDC